MEANEKIFKYLSLPLLRGEMPMIEEKCEIKEYRTFSGIPLKRVYTPDDIKNLDYYRDLGDPGEPPYTRGPYPNMYRERLWRIFQLSGIATPKVTREKILKLLEFGETGFIVEIDQLTGYHMYDLDHPEVLARKHDVGLTGPVMMSLKDYEELLEGIPIEKYYAHPGGVIPQLGPFVHACYWSVALKRGIPLNILRGTGESDFFLSYVGCPVKDQIPPRAGLRLNCDLIEFAIKNVPLWVPVSIAGYNGSESGLNAYQELAAVFACIIDHIEELLQRGYKIDQIAPRLGGVSFSTTMDFFESICKLRAARRMWYKLMKERYGAKDPRSLRLRIHVVTAGSFMTYQQPLLNIVRGTIMGLAAVLGGVQSLGISGFDEAICTPSDLADLIRIRTQHILQQETNIPAVADPLGGSYYVEWLTNEIEKRAWEYLEEIESKGGFIAVLESEWLLNEAKKGMFEIQRKIASGEFKQVGVNFLRMSREEEEKYFKIEPYRAPEAFEEAWERLMALRRERDKKKVEEALSELRKALEKGENVMPAMFKAVQAYATIGEIGNVQREVFGTWEPRTYSVV